MKTNSDIEQILNEDKDKFEFDNLPSELQLKIAQTLSNPDLLNFAMVSQGHWSFFKEEEVDVRKLLHHVVRGEHDLVQSMLRNNIDLIFKRGKVTDCSGRTFDNISAFEYALWALDKHMWDAMLACIPENEDRRPILAKLHSRYDQVNIKGVTYRLNGNTITEQHFDFANTIIKELRHHTKISRAASWFCYQDLAALQKHWVEGVGGTQKLLPMHVVHEYCSPEPFYPVPNFTSKPQSFKQFWKADNTQNWFGPSSELALELAILKGTFGRAYAMLPPLTLAFIIKEDIDALEKLCEVRTIDFIRLESQLEEQLTTDKTPGLNIG
ncbi:hypothetical protein FOLKNPGA_00547 [Legionella sp. PC1000]|uniref:F-box protein n=1 Tax=Legionella sp. PC1000 TaxID=2746060 RepID=UPI0015F94DF1|nr:F-box protein [Legionella sp. PC1000]QLZ67774.1 hypothetical protein FOLKNPGA_00547 [Legionella sp. PC1000]